jgi:hypothetical protein
VVLSERGRAFLKDMSASLIAVDAAVNSHISAPLPVGPIRYRS